MGKPQRLLLPLKLLVGVFQVSGGIWVQVVLLSLQALIRLNRRVTIAGVVVGLTALQPLRLVLVWHSFEGAC